MKVTELFILIALVLWPNTSVADVSGPIYVSIGISKFPIINETASITLKIVSIYDAPNTTAEVILPQGCVLSGGEISKTLDLIASRPVFLNASIKFTQIGEYKLEANAVHVTGPNSGWVDSDTIFLSIGTNTSYPIPPPTYVGELVQVGIENRTQIGAKAAPITLERMNEIAKVSPPPISERKPIFTEKKSGKEKAISNDTIVSVSGTPDIQVTLFWNDQVDLDLHVTDPNNEEIYYGHKTSASGGRLDRDNHCGNWIQDAPENVIWPENTAPSGHYIIKVVYYADCTSHQNPTSFKVKVYIKGQEFEIPMTISPPAAPYGGVVVWEFDYPNLKALTLRGNVGYYTSPGPYRDNANTRVSAKHFMVQLRNGATQSVLGQGYTDSNGNFVINIDNPGADGVKCVLFAYHKWTVGEVGRTQLFDRELRVVFQGNTLSGLVDVYPFVLTNGNQQFPDGDHSFTGSLDVPQGHPYERACWLLDDLNRAFLYTPGDPGGCTIVWSPTSTDGTYFDPNVDQVHLKANDPITTDNAAIHEYGHNIMYNIYGSLPQYTPPISHTLPYAYEPVNAWVEGWAEFFPLAVNNDPIYHQAKVGSIEQNYDVESNTGYDGVTWASGDQCEGRVAGALWDIKDDINDGYDAYYFGFDPIWNTFSSKKVNSFREYWDQWLASGHSNDASKCLFQNTIYYRSAGNIPDHLGNYKGLGVWAMDYNGNGQWDGTSIDRIYWFGSPTDQPVVGDWNNDGKDEIGNYKGNGYWALDYNGNGGWDGISIDRLTRFGSPPSTDKPVVGDWNNDGKDEIGNYKGDGYWALDYNGNGEWDGISIDRLTRFGSPPSTDKPVVGDWNNDGKDEIGNYKGDGYWALDYNGNGEWDGISIDRLTRFGSPPSTDKPVVGDWNNDGKDEIGNYKGNGYWALDYNGNGEWDGISIDRLFLFGTLTDQPIVGGW
jgi:hypothetical protein